MRPGGTCIYRWRFLLLFRLTQEMIASFLHFFDEGSARQNTLIVRDNPINAGFTFSLLMYALCPRFVITFHRADAIVMHPNETYLSSN